MNGYKLLLLIFIVGIAHAADPLPGNFCETSMEAIDYHDHYLEYIPDAPKVVDFSQKYDYKYSGIFARYEVDLNNDGVIDTVFSLHSSTNSVWADFYFIISPDKKVDEGGISEEELSSKAAYIFPQAWGGCKKQRCALDEFGDIKLKLPKSLKGKSPYLRARYTNARILRYREKTYLYVYSESGASDIYGVLRPNPDGSMTQICVR